MYSQDQGDIRQRFMSSLGLLSFIAGVFAVSVEVFLHRSRTFGERYVGLQGVAALLAIPGFSIFWPGYDCTPLLYLLLAYGLRCFWIRMSILWRRSRGGPQVHSYYTGVTRFPRLEARIGERRVKSIVEPAFVILIGAVAHDFSAPLGSYLMLAGVGLLVSTTLSLLLERQRALDLFDASIESRQAAERFGSLSGNRR